MPAGTSNRRSIRAVALLGVLTLLAGLGITVAPVVASAGSGVGTGSGPAGQSLQVSPVNDLDPAGETVTITGRGFTAAAGYDIASEGLYVAFCVDKGAAVSPSPCVGGVDITGGTGASRWVTNNPYPGTPSVPVAADGSFSTNITVQSSDEYLDCLALPAGEQCKVIVRMDHRAGGDRSQDVKVPVTFGSGAPVGPSLAVAPATGVDPAGADLQVTGSGYPTDGNAVQVVFGPQPAGDTDTSRFGANVVVPAADIAADGSFAVTLPAVAAAYTGGDGNAYDFSAGGGFVSTLRADGQADPDGRWSASRPIAFAGAPVPVSTTTLVVGPTTVTTGQGIVMTAAVTANGSPVTSGEVEFRAGGTPLGVAALGIDGRATRTATFASPGNQSITAHFRGSDAATASQSAPVAVTVTAAPDPDPDPDPDPPSLDPSGTGKGTGPRGQTLTATPVDNLDPNGTVVDIEGAGFTSAAGFDLATDGLYVSFCVDNGNGQQPTPCVGGVDMEGGSGASKWVTNSPYEGVPPEAVSAVSAAGSFSTRISVKAADEYVDCLDLEAGKRCVIVARMDHRATADRSQDVKVQVCFAGESACAVRDTVNDGGDPSENFGGFPLAPVSPSSLSTPNSVYTPGASGSGHTRLAATGLGSSDLVLPGLLLMLGGSAMVVWSRRRLLVSVPDSVEP